MPINNHSVEDAPRSGQPKKQTPQVNEIVRSNVRTDHYGREKTCAGLAGDLSGLGYAQEDEANEKAWVDEERPGMAALRGIQPMKTGP
ncbi:hypothetical protein E4U59_007544 [Claviceps monticola]|nr:hypothetical protein E4U59_007544 [Claviceps monticola]